MINKRLFALGEKKYVYKIVLYQWISMLCNVGMILRLGYQLNQIYLGNFQTKELAITVSVFLGVLLVRGKLKSKIAKLGHLAGTGMKHNLRTLLYKKLLNLGPTYTKNLSTAEVMQVSTEGVDQLETYFGSYLPQFFYCMVAPLTLFLVAWPIDFLSALVLFLCVPLIPVSIVVIQKIAKKLLAKYWGLYAALGDNFLENIQAMTTLKIYKADEKYHEDMNKSAEHFRIITMKVLSMQLNSIIVMDTVAYGGAALGGIMAVRALERGSIDLMGAVVILLLASEFFLPMRALGSFFHIAMNGMAAADKIFGILDMDEPKDGEKVMAEGKISVVCQNLEFSYTAEKQVLKGVAFTAETGITALVGTSGCGKSTLASLLSRRVCGYEGGIQLGGVELREIAQSSLHSRVTRVSDQGYIFSGTVAETLCMAKETASEKEMIDVLKSVRLWEFLTEQEGLRTSLFERGSNFSGGQRQRLNLARALLRNSDLYIFDEVTSNIDAESETAIMAVICQMAKSKTVLLISHRLANVVSANQILLLKNGEIAERGTHTELLKVKGDYSKLFLEQQALENYGKGATS